ncbi:hypothetical protein FGB62_246g01 [Gracilaria domingensis]|nr:hypothetical protein FGB62_319g010 [Gracilaria domingensis]KAI0557975.1 hypothetical protein FGB62_246g01 [Gracilaria domingensis]
MSADCQSLAVDASELRSSVENNEMLLLHTDSIADQDITADDERSVSDDLIEPAATHSTIEETENGSGEIGIHNAKQIMLEVFGTDYSDDESDLSKE